MARIHVAADPTADDVTGYVSLSLAKIKCTPPALRGDCVRHLGHRASCTSSRSDCYRSTQSMPRPCPVADALRAHQRSKCLQERRFLLHVSSSTRWPYSYLLRAFGLEDIPGDPVGGMAVRVVDLEHNGIGSQDPLGLACDIRHHIPAAIQDYRKNELLGESYLSFRSTRGLVIGGRNMHCEGHIFASFANCCARNR